jgi:hypothetical protein
MDEVVGDTLSRGQFQDCHGAALVVQDRTAHQVAGDDLVVGGVLD